LLLIFCEDNDLVVFRLNQPACNIDQRDFVIHIGHFNLSLFKGGNDWRMIIQDFKVALCSRKFDPVNFPGI